jgi:hypothetical protein
MFAEYLIEGGGSFEMQCSNYTLKVLGEGVNISFLTGAQPKRVFIAFAKLKSELKTKPVPDIDPDTLVYFSHNFTRNISFDEIVNIDLKSAYANIFFADGLISEDLFNYICSMGKQQRLACVGMLAAKKEIFSFKNGVPELMPPKISQFAPFFYYAIKRCSEIMNELRRICGQYYLFTWVDGIYFRPSAKKIMECEQYLETVKIPCSVDYLENFRVRIKARKVTVDFVKDGEDKYFNIPFFDQQAQNAMLKAISLSNNKNKVK